MRLQADLEIAQNKIKILNKKYNVEMFSSCIRGGKAYAAEQKIREFKKLLFKSKRVHRATTTKRFDLRKLIRLAVENINTAFHLKNVVIHLMLLRKNHSKVKDSGRSTIFIDL